MSLQPVKSIKWRLNVLMAEQELRHGELAEKAGLHPMTVSRHRSMKTMPVRLDAQTLEKYCRALECQPGDLLRYMPELDEQRTSKT